MVRPRTAFVLKTKDRRCSKCGAKLNSQVTRCRRCAGTNPRPRKRK